MICASAGILRKYPNYSVGVIICKSGIYNKYMRGECVVYIECFYNDFVSTRGSINVVGIIVIRSHNRGFIKIQTASLE